MDDREYFLRNYEKRLLTFDKSIFAEFENAYISTYDTYNTTNEVLPVENKLCTYGNILFKVCIHHGINVKGVTSERRHKGKYIVPLLGDDTRENSEVIYVGKFNFFTKKKSHRLRPIPRDYKKKNCEQSLSQ